VSDWGRGQGIKAKAVVFEVKTKAKVDLFEAKAKATFLSSSSPEGGGAVVQRVRHLGL